MSGADEDPRCPECGEPIGMTATYCMHCSADLTDERAAADDDQDGAWDESSGGSATDSVTDAFSGSDESGGGVDVSETLGVSSPAEDGQLLDPDGVVDNTLTVVVGIVGGIVVGVVGTIVLGILTGSGWALLFGLLAWLGATAYLVRQRTVQGAISKGAYAVALVLLLVPVVALSPLADIEGGIAARGSLFLVLLFVVAFPALIAVGVGWFAGQFVPDGPAGEG